MANAVETAFDLSTLVRDMLSYLNKMGILHEDAGIHEAREMFSDRHMAILKTRDAKEDM